MTPCEKAENSILNEFSQSLWEPFLKAVSDYELINENDALAVCISGGKDSMLLAKLIQLYKEKSGVSFDAVYLVMDPGYNPVNRKKIEDNAALLEVPITVFESDIFEITDKVTKSPCYLCARMRRGHLYAKAKELGCNKIALGHHFSDVIETTLLGMLYGSQVQAMLPKLHSTNFEGMELIRPLYCVHEDDIISWRDYNSLDFIQCACRFTEGIDRSGDGIGDSKRQEIKALIKKLKVDNPNVEQSIFGAIHNADADSFPAFKSKGKTYFNY